MIPAQTSEGMCSFLSPSVLQWDAMTTFVDCTVWQILKCMEEEVIGVWGISRTSLQMENSYEY